MTGRFRLGGTALATLLLAMLSIPSASAQAFAADPFFERAEPLRHAFALRLMESRLLAMKALLGEYEAPMVVEYARELTEDLVDEDLRLFAGSLASRDPELLERLQDGLELLQGRLGANEHVARKPDDHAREAADEAIAEVAEILAAVEAVLVPAEAIDPPFVAAVIALLLLSEDGVAEAYEDAVSEDPTEFALGWAALQKAEGAWGPLSDGVNAPLREDIDEALAELRRLLPKPLPEGDLTGDPEDAEEPSHRVVALLERATDARLHPDRDLGQLVRYVRSLVEQGCDDLATGSDLLAMERLAGAFLGYEYLEDLVGLMAPSANEQIDGAFERLLAEEEPASEGECGLLLDGLEEVRSIVGG